MENGSEIMRVSKPKERARSRAFTELCLMFAESMSVRDGVSFGEAERKNSNYGHTPISVSVKAVK